MARKEILPILIPAIAMWLGYSCCVMAGEIAKVGETSITSDQVKQTIARQGLNVYEEASIRKGLDAAVRFELFAAEAKKLELEKDPALARQIKELMVEHLISEKVDKQMVSYHAALEDVETYFKVHTNEFRRPALARGSIITILVGKDKEADAQTKAALALNELKSTLKPESVVRAYSDDPSEKVSGGVSSFFIDGEQSRRYPQAVADAMLALTNRGDVAGPIALPRALYVMKLTERRDAQALPYEQVKAEIYRRLAQVQREKLLVELTESLKKDIPVTIDEAQLKAAFPKTTNQSSPPPGPNDMP